ncbi:MAG: alkyl sulfatase dimerization domain-containing protein [Acidimicrobiales bacterium]
MADLLALSARIVDSGRVDQPVNRVSNELSEVDEHIAVVESFSHSVALRTEEGLVVFDASGAPTGEAVVAALRGWSEGPVNTLVYTHGHLDHVGGSPAFVSDAAARRHPRPRFVAHAGVRDRFARYRMTDGYNRHINARQFGWLRNPQLRIGAGGAGELDATAGGRSGGAFLPDDVAEPDVAYHGRAAFSVGGVDVELHHARGETDDHTWAWIPSLKAVCSGDFLIWNFPNAGNPQKVQRYPAEWATALRTMASLEPELLLPAHGLPIGGTDRVRRVLCEVASALEHLVGETLAMMNTGASLDEVVHGVTVPADTLALPYLRPLYDEPEFVVRNIWRLYGGWWDGNPARLKPPPDAALAAEVATLAGGTEALVARARGAAATGDHRLACQLVEWATQADPASAGAHRARAELYQQRRDTETSLMAKGIFASAVSESERRA